MVNKNLIQMGDGEYMGGDFFASPPPSIPPRQMHRAILIADLYQCSTAQATLQLWDIDPNTSQNQLVDGVDITVFDCLGTVNELNTYAVNTGFGWYVPSGTSVYCWQFFDQQGIDDTGQMYEPLAFAITCPLPENESGENESGENESGENNNSNESGEIPCIPVEREATYFPNFNPMVQQILGHSAMDEGGCASWTWIDVITCNDSGELE